MLLVGVADGNVRLFALLGLARCARSSPEYVETQRRGLTLELKRFPTFIEPNYTNERRMSGFEKQDTELLSRSVGQQQEERLEENNRDQILRCVVSLSSGLSRNWRLIAATIDLQVVAGSTSTYPT